MASKIPDELVDLVAERAIEFVDSLDFFFGEDNWMFCNCRAGHLMIHDKAFHDRHPDHPKPAA